MSNKEFENNYNVSYSDELKLKKDNEVPFEASFSDLSAEFHGKKITTELFDKRDTVSYQPYAVFG